MNTSLLNCVDIVKTRIILSNCIYYQLYFYCSQFVRYILLNGVKFTALASVPWLPNPSSPQMIL